MFFDLSELGDEFDALAVELRADAALVPFGDRARDGKPDAKAAAGGARCVRAIKAVEELAGIQPVLTRAAVGCAQYDAVPRLFQRDGDAGALCGVFDRIVEQNGDELAHRVFVAPDKGKPTNAAFIAGLATWCVA